MEALELPVKVRSFREREREREMVNSFTEA